MEWKYERTEQQFDEIPVGLHRLRISSAEKKISRNGNDMIELIFEVSGYTSRIWHYIVFLCDKPEITNRNLTALFDSFAIEEGNFNTRNWIGKVGAGMVKHDDDGHARISYLVNKSKQENLPAWKEPSGGKAMTPNGQADGFAVVDDDKEDLPF